MREIKFRGREQDGFWTYGDLRHDDNVTGIIENGIYSWVDSSTVGPFIGLKDSTGKEIYEGDIVDFTENICDGDEVIIQGRGYVKYDDNTAVFVIVNDGFIPFIEIGEMRIIGNVYDNLDLLEATE